MAKIVPMKERVKNFYFKLFERGDDRSYNGRPVEQSLPEIYRDLMDKGLFDYMIDRVGKDSITYKLFIENFRDSIRSALEVIHNSFIEELENTIEVLYNYDPRTDKRDIKPVLKKYNLLSKSIRRIRGAYHYENELFKDIDIFYSRFNLLQRECTNALLFERVYDAHFTFLWHDLLIALDGGLFEQLFSLITSTLEKDGYIKWNEMEDDFIFIDQ